MIGLSLIFSILLIAFILVVLRFIKPKLSLRIKAYNDYRNARGTKHVKFLQGTYTTLNKKKAEITTLINDLEVYVKMLEIRRQRELEIAASQFLVQNELTKVVGIGETLKQRIMMESFDDTLTSLNKVEHIQGIGLEKALAIRRWVKKAIPRLPKILQEEFQGKQRIVRKFNKALHESTQQKTSHIRDLQQVEELLSKIDHEVRWLTCINPSTFRRALKGDISAANQVSHYMQGIYPEWEEMPKWLTNLKKIVN
jgi:hypothetical protein